MALADLQMLVDDLAQRLGAPTVLEDREQRMVVYSSQSPPIDEVRRDSILRRETRTEIKEWFRQFGILHATSPLRTPSHPALAILGRVCAPVRFHGRLMGFLFVIDDDTRLSAEQIEVVDEAQRRAGPLLYEEETAQRLSASVLSHLLAPAAELREAAARQVLDEGLAEAGLPHAVVYLRLAAPPQAGPTRAGLQEAITGALWELGRSRGQAGVLSTVRRDHGVLMVPVPAMDDDRPAQAVAAQARSLLARHLEGDCPARVIAGIGDPQPHVTTVAASCRQAMLAARVAAAVPSAGDQPRWRDLGAYRVLVQLPPGEISESSLDPRMAALLEAGDALAQTVETYLDLGGDVKRTSQRLHLHRASLYYRLDKAQRLTGADLGDGGDRLALHLGFKLARLTGRYNPVEEIRNPAGNGSSGSSR
jgi:PucR C-terminal helix-turn-helix domain/GGDEF-like domain